MMTLRDVTSLLLVFLVVGLTAYDVLVYFLAGPEATVSIVMADFANNYPIVAVLFGLMGGHVFALAPVCIGAVIGCVFWSIKPETWR